MVLLETKTSANLSTIINRISIICNNNLIKMVSRFSLEQNSSNQNVSKLIKTNASFSENSKAKTQ